MKIGYLVQRNTVPLQSAPYDGRSIHVQQVIQELQARGHQVALLIQENGQIWYSENLVEFEPVTTPWLDQGPLHWLAALSQQLQAQWRLPTIAFFENLRFLLACCHLFNGYDLLYERMSWMGYGAMVAARWLAIPHILEVNGDPNAEAALIGKQLRPLQARCEQVAMQQLINYATYVVTAGEGWRQSFLQRWQVAPHKVTTVENGSQIVQLLACEQLQAFRSGESLVGPVTLAYLGGFYRWHGVQVLLHAYAQALAQGANLHLLLIGNGAELDECKTLVRALKIETYVTFTGTLTTEQLAHQLARAAIGVSPYCGRQEFSGLKLFDYMAAGLAIIASGADGHPIVLEHGRTGWIVPPCCIEALTAAILHLSAHTELRQGLGRAARMEAERHYTWRHTAHHLEQIFTEAAA